MDVLKVFLALIVLSSLACATSLIYTDVFIDCEGQGGMDLIGCSLYFALPNLHYRMAFNMGYGAIIDGAKNGALDFFYKVFWVGIKGSIEWILNALAYTLSLHTIGTPYDINDLLSLASVYIDGTLAPLKWLFGIFSSIAVYLFLMFFIEVPKAYLWAAIPLNALLQLMELSGLLAERDKFPIELVMGAVILVMFFCSIFLLYYDFFWGWLSWL
jgi:hypothetical protein